MRKKYNKRILCLFTGAAFAVMAGCNLNSSDSEKSKVSDYEDLPNCSANESKSGVHLIDEEVYVENEEMSYLCTDSGWVVTSVDEFDNLPKCPGKRNKALGMKVYVKKDSVQYLCVNTGWIEWDSAEEYTPDPELDNGLVQGLAMVIGPFEKGSSVVLRDIGSTKDSAFAASGTGFEGTVTTNGGSFLVSKATVFSRFALLSVKGLYLDVLTGTVSEDSLQLDAVIEVQSGETPVVDVASHIMAARIRVLVNGGAEISAAVEQARVELLAAFGFRSDFDESTVRLAIALLLRAYQDEDAFVDALDAFVKDFSDDGEWSDEDARTLLGDFAYNIENLKIKDEDSGALLLKESDYRRNLEQFGLENIPAFEELFTRFWAHVYGLGVCAEARQGAVMQNRNEKSDSASAYFTCDGQAWRVSTEFERDTVGLGEALDGEMKEGNVDTEKMYVYDTTGTGAGAPVRWTEPDSITLVIGASCTEYDEVKYSVESTEDEDGNENYYGCEDRSWISVSETEYEIGYLCNASVNNAVESYKHEKTDMYARCRETRMEMEDGTEERSYAWIPTDKANYELVEKTCTPFVPVAYKSSFYYCEDAVDINYKEMTDVEHELGVCREAIEDSIGVYESSEKQYVACFENSYVSGEWSWNETDEITYKIGRACYAKTIDEETEVESVSYICGCSVYNSATGDYEIKTDLEECGTNKLAWHKKASME